jgi:hypothetical protein
MPFQDFEQQAWLMHQTFEERSILGGPAELHDATD